jgi:DNA-binding transcriptional ArsR family regulator
MQKYITNIYKSNPSKKHTKSYSDQVVHPDLELIAKELDTLARQRLPDGVLQGNLTGYEAEIRQDSILLALSWYLRQHTDEAHRVKYSWIPARALAHALKLQKRDRLKALDKDRKRSSGIPAANEPTSLHPAMIRPSDWSASTIEPIVREAILTALRRERISLVNAAIAMEVFVAGAPASEVADRLRMSRSNIYQHLQRTKRIVAEIIEQIEVPLMDPM